MRHLLPLLTGLSLLAGPAAAAETVIAVCEARAAAPVTIAIFATAADFKAHENPVATLTLAPQADGTAEAQIDLPPGTYAAAAIQDTDGDGGLTTNMLGLPTEPYGFSGGGGRFGPPAFNEAAFAVPAVKPVLVCLQEL